jgi:hypothetical protein
MGEGICRTLICGVISSFGKDNRLSASLAIALCAAGEKMKVPLDPPVSTGSFRALRAWKALHVEKVAVQICVVNRVRILPR